MSHSGYRNRILIYAILIAAILVTLFLPERILFNEQKTLCAHKLILGIECPLCGMTRATHELLHFRLMNAFKYNFTIVFLIFFIVADGIYYLFPSRVSFIARKTTSILLLSGWGVLYIWRLVQHFGL
jgi:hypothetical protein